MGLSSCVNDLDVEPIDPRKNTTVDAQKLFNKCYAEFVFEGYAPGESELDLGDAGLSVLYRLLWNANELTTDEALCGWNDKGVGEFDYNTYTPANECLYGLYWRLSLGVTICNQYLKECADYDASMTAEVHFIRALYYYFLLDNYGNPSFSETVGEKPRQIKSEELFTWIAKELEDNMDGMLAPSVRKKGAANYGRADQSAAWMLLARLYLNAEKYTGTAQWEKAKEYADKVIKQSGRSIWMGDDATVNTRVLMVNTQLIRCCLWPTMISQALSTRLYSHLFLKELLLHLGVLLHSYLLLLGMPTWLKIILRRQISHGVVIALV